MRNIAMEESCARYLVAHEAEKIENAKRREQEIAAFEHAELPADLADLPVSSYYGGPPSLRDTARAATTVTEATFDSPRNYEQETILADDAATPGSSGEERMYYVVHSLDEGLKKFKSSQRHRALEQEYNCNGEGEPCLCFRTDDTAVSVFPRRNVFCDGRVALGVYLERLRQLSLGLREHKDRTDQQIRDAEHEAWAGPPAFEEKVGSP